MDDWAATVARGKVLRRLVQSLKVEPYRSTGVSGSGSSISDEQPPTT